MTQRLEGRTQLTGLVFKSSLWECIDTAVRRSYSQLTGLVFKSSLWECSDTAVRRSDSVDRTGVQIISMGV